MKSSIRVESIQIRKNLRETSVSSTHSNLIRCMINADEKQINEVINIYRNIEKEYNNKQYVKRR